MDSFSPSHPFWFWPTFSRQPALFPSSLMGRLGQSPARLLPHPGPLPSFLSPLHGLALSPAGGPRRPRRLLLPRPESLMCWSRPSAVLRRSRTLSLSLTCLAHQSHGVVFFVAASISAWGESKSALPSSPALACAPRLGTLNSSHGCRAAPSNLKVAASLAKSSRHRRNPSSPPSHVIPPRAPPSI